jgi:hypothetical protein
LQKSGIESLLKIATAINKDIFCKLLIAETVVIISIKMIVTATGVLIREGLQLFEHIVYLRLHEIMLGYPAEGQRERLLKTEMEHGEGIIIQIKIF